MHNNRADYTNALMQAVAQQRLAKQTNPLANEMALKPRASQSLTRPGPPPPVPDISGSEFPPQFEPFVPDTLEPVTVPQELGHISSEQIERMKGFSRATGGGAFPELGSEMPLQVNKKGEDYNPDRQWTTQSLIALFPEVDPRVFYGMSDEELRMFYSKQLHLQQMKGFSKATGGGAFPPSQESRVQMLQESMKGFSR